MSHWYTETGKAAHFLGKGGKGTTLREARKSLREGNPLYPSVTTILNYPDKFQLNRWRMRKIVELLWLSGEPLETLSMKQAVDYGLKLYADYMDSVKDPGLEVHLAIEQCFLADGDIGAVKDLKWVPSVQGVLDLLNEKCPDQKWIPEETIVHQGYGYAGRTDLRSPEWVVDIKSKEFDEGQRPFIPEENGQQLAAYDEGEGRRLANIFVARNKPGLVYWKEFDAQRNYWPKFLANLNAWKVNKDYDPIT